MTECALLLRPTLSKIRQTFLAGFALKFLDKTLRIAPNHEIQDKLHQKLI